VYGSPSSSGTGGDNQGMQVVNGSSGDGGGAPVPFSSAQEISLISGLQSRVKNGSETDCNALTDYLNFVGGPLEGDSSAAAQIKAALSLLTPNQFPVNMIPGISGNQNYQALNPNGATSGFKLQYQDEIANADQVHHFAAFFQLGFTYGNSVGMRAATWWEKLEGTAGNTGDINLGRIAATIGANVRAGVLPVYQLGQAVRESLCK
jgi:hypothetical protein